MKEVLEFHAFAGGPKHGDAWPVPPVMQDKHQAVHIEPPNAKKPHEWLLYVFHSEKIRGNEKILYFAYHGEYPTEEEATTNAKEQEDRLRLQWGMPAERN